MILTSFYDVFMYLLVNTPASDAPGEPLYNWTWIFYNFFYIYSTSATHMQILSFLKKTLVGPLKVTVGYTDL